jgi:hypothetical protein
MRFIPTKGIHTLPFSLLILLLLSIFGIPPMVCQGESDLIITSHTGFLDANGYYTIYGEVENKGSKNYSDIKLKYTFYDSSGNILYVEEGTGTRISLSILLSGRRSPFSYVLTNETLATKVKNYTIKISSKKILKEVIPAKLQILHHKPVNDTLLLILYNSGSVDAKYVALYTTFYDVNKSVIAINSRLATIGPNDRISFIIEIPTSSYNFNLTDVKYYSITAESIYPQYILENEISYAIFSEDISYPDPIWTIFVVIVSFSAAVLISAYLIAKYRQGKKRPHTRKSIKKKSQLKVSGERK